MFLFVCHELCTTGIAPLSLHDALPIWIDGNVDADLGDAAVEHGLSVLPQGCGKGNLDPVDVDGVKIAFTASLRQDGQAVLDRRVTEIRINVPIDPDRKSVV